MADETDVRLGAASWIVLLLVAAVPPLFATGFSAFEHLKSGVSGVGAALALVVWGIQVARAGRLRLLAARTALLGGAFGVYVLVSVAWSPGWLWSAPHAAYVLALASIYLVLTAPVGRAVDFRDFASAVAVGTGLSALGGLLDLAGVGIFTTVWDPPGPTGPFDSMEAATAYYAVALPVVAGGVFRTVEVRRYALAAACLLGAAHAGLVATWPAIGAILVAGGLAWAVAWAYSGRFGAATVLPVAALLGVVAVTRVVGGATAGVPTGQNAATSIPRLEPPNRQQEGQLDEPKLRNTAFASGRTESVRTFAGWTYLWQVGRRLVEERPLIGHGPGAWWRLQTKYPVEDHPYADGQFLSYPTHRSPHNVWVRLAVDYGALGSILFLLWLIGVASAGLAGWRATREEPAAVHELWALWTAVLAGLAVGSFTHLFELAPAALVWVGAAAVLVGRATQRSQAGGAAAEWKAGHDEALGGTARTVLVGTALVVGLGVGAATTVATVGNLFRGWGDQLMLRTRYQRAVERYRRADAWYPARGDVLYNIALAASRAGSLRKHRDRLERASQLRPYDARIATLQSRAALGAGEIESSIRHARRALDHHPNNIEARKLLAATLRRRAKLDQAAEQLLKLIERGPPEDVRARVHFQLGRLYAGSLKAYQKAKKHFRKAKSLTEVSSIVDSIDREMKELKKKITRERKKREGKVPPPPGMKEKRKRKIPTPPDTKNKGGN
ncbi:MAG: O-antigen ligase family protein [Bradymonadaceae bacterium]